MPVASQTVRWRIGAGGYCESGVMLRKREQRIDAPAEDGYQYSPFEGTSDRQELAPESPSQREIRQSGKAWKTRAREAM